MGRSPPPVSIMPWKNQRNSSKKFRIREEMQAVFVARKKQMWTRPVNFARSDSTPVLVSFVHSMKRRDKETNRTPDGALISSWCGDLEGGTQRTCEFVSKWSDPKSDKRTKNIFWSTISWPAEADIRTAVLYARSAQQNSTVFIQSRKSEKNIEDIYLITISIHISPQPKKTAF